MALTGAGKLAVLVVVAGVVGGGIYYGKTLLKKQAQPVVVESQQNDSAQATIPQTIPAQQDEAPAQVSNNATPPVETQTQQGSDPEMNRGMKALLNAGKNQ